MGIFDDDVEAMLEMAGDECEATIKGVCTTFYGIFDQENRLETDTAGQSVIITGSKLTVATCLWKKMTRGETTITIRGDQWKVRDGLIMDDGALTALQIVEV